MQHMFWFCFLGFPASLEFAVRESQDYHLPILFVHFKMSKSLKGSKIPVQLDGRVVAITGTSKTIVSVGIRVFVALLFPIMLIISYQNYSYITITSLHPFLCFQAVPLELALSRLWI